MYLIPAILFSGCIVFNVSLFLEKRMGYSNKISKKISFTIFLAYVVVIFYTAFLSREPGSRKSISLVLFETWGCTFHMHAMFIENIIMFIPFGILNPLLFRKFRNARVCVLAGFICSCSIEVLQHITQTGYLQLDDVMTNTIGTILGWLAWKVGFYNKCHLAMPLSQMFDKVFGMIKSDMYAIKLQEKVRELSVLDTTNRQIRVICLKKSIR